ncbi:ATP-binding protein [Candidatus Omnitrophota bacterium]
MYILILIVASISLIFILILAFRLPWQKHDKCDSVNVKANIVERLGTIINLGKLKNELQGILKQVLDVSSFQLVLDNSETEFIQWLLRYAGPITIKKFSQRYPELYKQDRELLKQFNAFVLVSLDVEKEKIGMLAIGKKDNKQGFSSQDMELLKIIGQQASRAILNAGLKKEHHISCQMEGFHKLSAYITQDLKNFVSLLSIFVENAEKNFASAEFKRNSLANISGTIAKMNNLIQRLSSLPKKLVLKAQPLNINVLINETINKLNINYGNGIKLSRLFDYMPQIAVDVKQMQQVFQNLTLNAIEAMPKGGSITIKTSYHEGIGAFNDKYIQVIYKDTGFGMSGEFIQESLFKPFHSTKHKNIGIGLFQCKTIIEAHGGEIFVESQEGKGSNFIIRLPVKDEHILKNT